MNQCRKCGAEFEGKFCPECGTAFSDTPVCPQCGAELSPSAKFCPNCGHDLIGQSRPIAQPSAQPSAQPMPASINWRRILNYIPTVLFVLWAALLWAFFACKVIVGDGFFVQGADLYQLLKDQMMSDMHSGAKALMVIAAIADVYAVVYAIMAFKSKIRADNAISYGSFAMHLTVIIGAAVLLHQCNVFTEGVEGMRGNMCAVTISLTVVFAVLQAVTIVASNHFEEGNSQEVSVSQKERQPRQTPKLIVNTKKWVVAHKALAGFLAATFVATAVLCTVLPVTVGNIFRIGKVKKINIGDTAARVEKVLGKPFEPSSNEYEYNYYSKNVIKLMERLENLYKQEENITDFDKLDKLMAQEEKLEQQLELLDYKQITVQFNDGQVVGLNLDTHVSDVIDKTVDKDYIGKRSISLSFISLLNQIYTIDLVDVLNKKIPEHIEFTDGSYLLTTLTNDAVISDIKFVDEYGKKNIFPVSGIYSWTNQYGKQNQSIRVDSGKNNFNYGIYDDILIFEEQVLTKSFFNTFDMEVPWENRTITKLRFGKDVEYIPPISELGIDESNLKNIEVDSANKNYSSQEGILFNKSGTRPLYFPIKHEKSLKNTEWFKAQPEGLVYYENELIGYNGTMPENCELTVRDGTTSILYNALQEEKNLVSIKLPSSVTSIGEYAFYGCDNLKTVSFANYSQLKIIKEYAFIYCKSLSSIFIPSNVTTIGSYAFNGCESLTSISIPSSVTSIGESAFSGCSSMTSISIPSSVTSIGYYAFDSCRSLTIYCEASSQPSIWNLFWDSSCPVVWDCKNNRVADDGYMYIFVNGVRYGLKDGNAKVAGYNYSGDIVIPQSVEYGGTQYAVTSIGDDSFSNCNSLTSIFIPSSVTSIGNSAFSDCSSLTIYCEALSQPAGWSDTWNQNCPVVWGYQGEE